VINPLHISPPPLRAARTLGHPCTTSLVVSLVRVLTCSMSARGHIRSIGLLAYLVVPIWCEAEAKTWNPGGWALYSFGGDLPSSQGFHASVLRNAEPVAHSTHSQDPPGGVRIRLDLEPDPPDVLGHRRPPLPLLG
jgi:hypothetical protein